MLAGALVAACTAHRPAPVVDRTAPAKPAAPAKSTVTVQPAWRPPDTRPEFYTVRPGDTLYSIALDHGIDYRDLALWNGISNTGTVKPGQQLRLSPPQTAATTAPLQSAPGVQARPLTGAPVAPADTVKSQPLGVRVPYSEQAYAQLAAIKPDGSPPAKPEAPSAAPGSDGDEIQFIWPTNGKVVNTFNDGANLKGIGIAGKSGQPVYASAPGRVIFSGTGIRGFGKLIVIKHNNTFLSVYGHNSELLVKEGQNVSKGQKIAEMGNTDADQVKLHFEIRRYGKPVDPVKLLPEQPG
ncbi:MAG TPA: peptidoglycan DD-metalloendopeptidase family protein [Burkholderiales bacterium]|nr:peptidoglycan DD-metalloendopeptidase family protein [Burkholderiales bacterium]